MNKKLRAKFQRRARALAQAKRKGRYLRAIGKLKRAKLLDAPGIPEFAGPVDIEDVLWAGTLEPRILEVLPALVVSRPSYLRMYKVPEDLGRVIGEIHSGNPTTDFRGIPAKDYCKWLRPGNLGGVRLKTFRMRPEEVQLLKKLRVDLSLRSEAEVLRRALRSLEEKTN